MRKHQLQKEPLCRLCAKEGRVCAATVADHITPHRGNEELFFDETNLQSLCKPCHDYTKKMIELHGYYRNIGVDGFPVDDQHPVNKG